MLRNVLLLVLLLALFLLLRVRVEILERNVVFMFSSFVLVSSLQPSEAKGNVSAGVDFGRRIFLHVLASVLGAMI